MIFGQPQPLQPEDTTDKVIGLSVAVYGPIDWLEEVEFECSQCHKSYWRKVLSREHFTEVVEVEGVLAPDGKPAQYALNPTLISFYGPRLHECG